MGKGNIILIGMPGAGKSTVGVLLAKSLRMPFIDTDLVIQQVKGMYLQDIIDKFGIAEFLEIEKKVILSLDIENHVIATGGSAVYSLQAIKHLREPDGLVIYLKLAFKSIERRIRNISSRGIAMNTGQTLVDVYKERIPLYKSNADITVNCYGKHMEQIVTEIRDMVLIKNNF